MDRTPDIAFNQRFAVVGKTRSGKSTFAVILANLLVPWKRRAKWSDPEVWFIDTKHSPDDIEYLQKWGFKFANPREKCNYKIFMVDSKGDGKQAKKQWEVAQEIFKAAYDYGGVCVMVDEYTQTVPNRQDAGEHLYNLFTKGGGLGVGVIGLTQEPVYVPRQLLSQATHQILFDLSYPNDIKRIREFFDSYERPLLRKDNHGLYHIAVDYDGLGRYYKNYKEWVEQNELMERLLVA